MKAAIIRDYATYDTRMNAAWVTNSTSFKKFLEVRQWLRQRKPVSGPV